MTPAPGFSPAPSAAQWPRYIGPSAITALVLAAYLALSLAQNNWDPLALAVLGDGWQDGVPVGQEGYDGQFSYYLALDPRPAAAAVHLDVPAYRYQRILYPLAARALALGLAAWIPWTLIFVNFAAHVIGTWLVERWLVGQGVNRWYALTYGLWAGLLIAARTDLNEPLCYALVAGAFLAHQRNRPWLAAGLLLLATLTKETALLFLAAAFAAAALARQRRLVVPGAWSVTAYGLFQLLLLARFGSFGLGSGGYRGTPFEIVPFMGLWRIGTLSLAALALFAVILVPLIVLPSVWGIAAALSRLGRKDFTLPVLALAANAAFLPFTPFSTFREPLGIIRLACGLVLAVIFFGAYVRSQRVLNYTLLWIAATVFILKG